MPQRRSNNSEDQKPINCLRRSPRLHCENQINAQSPKPPKPAETRFGHSRSFSTPLTKIKKTSHGVSENGRGKETLANQEKSRNGCRRSARTQRRGVDNEKNVGEIEKRVTRSSGKICTKKASNVSNTSRRKAVVSDEVEPKGDDELSKVDTSKKDIKDCGVVRRNGEQNCGRKGQIGEKRKRDGVEEQCETARGWSKEQEAALQRAYFTAKPTPQFWKEVSRMVPGKSAEECFDRIHSDHLTPPQPRTRSRAKIKDPSPLSFSASKLLSPAATKSKRLGFRRRTLQAQKTVRQILQKQQKEDQDYNADLFAFLEPTIYPVLLQEGGAFVSPPQSKASPFLTGSQIKHASRLDRLQKAGFTSPPVLKQIKNKALHEKYIDQLHCRDAKRKAEALRNTRNGKEQIDEKVNHLKQNLVKVAKDALVSDAQDAISKFQSLLSRVDEDDDSTSRSDDDDDDDEDEDDDGV